MLVVSGRYFYSSTMQLDIDPLLATNTEMNGCQVYSKVTNPAVILVYLRKYPYLLQVVLEITSWLIFTHFCITAKLTGKKNYLNLFNR